MNATETTPDRHVALIAEGAAALAELGPTRKMLSQFGVGFVERLVTPNAPADWSDVVAVIVASVDGLLPGAVAAATTVAVVRVPIAGAGKAGLDLLRDAAMQDSPVGAGSFATVAIGEAGAKNAALLVISILSLNDARLRGQWEAFRRAQTDAVLNGPSLEVAE